MSTVKSLLIYAGLNHEEMAVLLPEAMDENERNLEIYSLMTVIIFGLCLLVSILAGGQLVINRTIYILMLLSGCILYLSAKYVLPRRHSLSTVLCIVYILDLYAYSFTVSLLHHTMPGVSAVAILLVTPCLFNYRPVYMIIMTTAALVIYCTLSAFSKESSIAMLDLWNCLFFGSIAILLSVFLMKVKFRLFFQRRENRYLSETDILTGAKKRNCFESSKKIYQDTCNTCLHCIFLDANGLHELNNSMGHDAGDRMLQTVAGAIIRNYGQQNTYRIGGDEFLAFSSDSSDETVLAGIRDIVHTVDDAGYSVSIGTACQQKDSLDLSLLVNTAEIAMYQNKRTYYANGNHDRRQH